MSTVPVGFNNLDGDDIARVVDLVALENSAEVANT